MSQKTPLIPQERLLRDVRGNILTLGDLPKQNARWTPIRKSIVVALVEAGKTTVEKMRARYGLTEGQYREWQQLYAKHGLNGLRATRQSLSHFRITPPAEEQVPATSTPEAGPVQYLEAGPVRIDLMTREVAVGRARVHFPDYEYRLLEFLLVKKGEILTKGMLFDHLYGNANEPEFKIIDVFICKIRKKLGPDSHWIETIWGRGYRFCKEARQESLVPA